MWELLRLTLMIGAIVAMFKGAQKILASVRPESGEGPVTKDEIAKKIPKTRPPGKERDDGRSDIVDTAADIYKELIDK